MTRKSFRKDVDVKKLIEVIKMKILFKIILLSCALLFPAWTSPMAMTKPLSSSELFTKGFTETAKAYAKYYAVSFVSTLSHELGHLLTARLLLGIKGELHIVPSMMHVGGYISFKNVQIPQGLGTAASMIAGPLCGAGAGYFLLKANNVMTEYKKTNSIPEAIKSGMKKSCFDEQGTVLKVAVIYNGIGDLLNLIPIEVDAYGRAIKSDGSQALTALNISHTPMRLNI
jgi:hypothetical protein